MTINPNFAGGPQVSESIEAREAREAADAQYQRELESADFGSAAEDLRDSLGFKPFIPPEQRQEEIQGVSLEQGQEDIEVGAGEIQSEYTPIIQRFIAQGYITLEEGEELIESSINAENYHTIITASNLDGHTQAELIQSLEYLDSPERSQLAETELQEGFPELFGDFKEIDASSMSPFAITAYREVSNHYIPNEDPEARQANLGLALEMASNKIVNDVQLNLNPGNRQTFFDAMEQVKNSQAEFSERFTALQRVTEIVNSGESIKGAGARSKADFRVAQQRRAEGAAQTEAFHAAQTHRISEAEESARIENTDTQSSPEEDIPSGGDVFSAGDLDLTHLGEDTREAA